MVAELSYYLKIQKNPKRFVSDLIIDSCGMTDMMLATVLKGLRKQSTLKSITYSNNEIGEHSFAEIYQIMPQLHELVITNVTKEVSPSLMKVFLDKCVK